jgi:penicillin-binding protein 1B
LGRSNLKQPRVILKLRGLARKRWVRFLLYATAAFAIAFGSTFFYFYFSYGDVIEERLHGERERTLPRVYGRAVELRRGQLLSVDDLVSRLNDLGYAQRPQVDGPGQFTVTRTSVSLMPREGPQKQRVVNIVFPSPPAAKGRGAVPPPARGIQRIQVGRGNVQTVELDPPLLTALTADGAREKRRRVPLASIPMRMRHAVLATEDQRFYSHSGINVFRLIGAVIRNTTNSKNAPSGASTITQQLARMFFLADEFNAELQTGQRGRTWGSRWRKAREIMMALALERRASKDEILEMYLNDVYLGQRGSFAIHGVAEASRIFFGKDVANISDSEAAAIAGSIAFPGLPFQNQKRAIERRNVVLQLMASEEFITPEVATTAAAEPLQIAPRAVDNEAPYFVDMVVQQVEGAYPGLMVQPAEISVFTTLDMNLQRAALEAMRNGLARVDELLSKRRRKIPERPQAALIAVDPRTGEILALVGGRSYNTSQYNRVTTARRQPGSVFKPFVYLAAFERGAEEGRTDLTPASLTWDEPAIFEYDNQVWEPKNYDDYDGEVTWRRALAMSRNLGTIRVGEQIGFDTVARLWRRVGVGTPPIAVPSITLGVFELTPLEVAQAYTLFTNGGIARPLKGLNYIQAGARRLRPEPAKDRPVARADTTFLVTNMLRSVLNEGTGASARASGFTPDAAGKSGTTNDQRDAWFVGFTPELLTVVWVGFDDNTPIGLTGSQAALPIWTEFMKVATAGRRGSQFAAPEGISFVEIDRDTGKLATPHCPRTFTESFITGTEPLEICPLHGF